MKPRQIKCKKDRQIACKVTLYQTCFTPPQLELIELDDEQWVKFQRRPSRTYSKRTAMGPQQLPLLDLGVSALVLLALNAM